MSTKFVLGNIVQLKTRNIYKIIRGEWTWDKCVWLNETIKPFKESFFGEIIWYDQIHVFCIFKKSLLFLSLIQLLNHLWDPFTMYRFADNKNAKLKKFNSKFWSPNTLQVDAFAIGWGNDNSYLVAPIYLVPKVIKHVQLSKG